MMTKDMMVISRYCHWYIRKMLDSFHLNNFDPIFLSFLKFINPVSQEHLCRCLLLDKATVAKTAARLEGQGYLHREINEQNKREKLLRLTETGCEIVERIDEVKALWEGICLANFSDSEKKVFLQLSARAAQNAIHYVKAKEKD